MWDCVHIDDPAMKGFTIPSLQGCLNKTPQRLISEAATQLQTVQATGRIKRLDYEYASVPTLGKFIALSLSQVVANQCAEDSSSNAEIVMSVLLHNKGK